MILNTGAFMCHVCDKKNEYLQHDSRKRSFLKLAAASALGLGISGAGISSVEEILSGAYLSRRMAAHNLWR